MLKIQLQQSTLEKTLDTLSLTIQKQVFTETVICQLSVSFNHSRPFSHASKYE